MAIKSTEIIQKVDLATDAAGKVRLHNIALAVDDLGDNWPLFDGIFPVAEIKVDTESRCRLRRKPPEADHLPSHSGIGRGYGARAVAKAARANFAAVRETEARPTIVCPLYGFDPIDLAAPTVAS